MMLVALCLCASGSLLAQTFTTLYLLGAGGSPAVGLVQGSDGNLYGTTIGGPGRMNGTIFKITPGGTFTGLHSGGAFHAALIQGTDGNFYGTSVAGGPGSGWVFKITPSGTLTTLHTFHQTDGYLPEGALVQASDGNFYGTTLQGGTNSCLSGGTNYGCGTLFKITASGTFTTLYNFCSQSGCTDGANPPGGLVQGTDGNLYGTTAVGGSNGGFGTVFKITTTGTLTTLHSFDSTDGQSPNGGLVQATDGNFYGTTQYGGSYNNCPNYTGFPGCGTVFKITPAGTLTTLHSFDGTVAAIPTAGLIQASDGNFYGTTSTGQNNGGTIFTITATGTLTTLHTFEGTTGSNPNALVQDTNNGAFYGTTLRGGKTSYHFCAAWCGTIFSLSVGLGPFVETQPASGAVGTAVDILRTNLTGASSVNFSDTAATFAVVSSSEITTTVPAGATTGEVKAVTSGGTLSSNVPCQMP